MRAGIALATAPARSSVPEGFPPMNRSATNDVADLARVEKDGQRAGDDRKKYHLAFGRSAKP